jgi:hypothetical protein
LTSEVELRFTLHRAFVANGKYYVFIGGKKAIINVKRERNMYALQEIFRKSTPLTPLEDFDIHGIVNICHVTMELSLPFTLVNSSQSDDVKSECLKYLNRLVEVIRYKTRKYWLLPVNNNELLYADISDSRDASGKRKEGHLDMSSLFVLHTPIKNESEVYEEIEQLLKSGQEINYSDSLILNAYNYILLGEYNDSILTSNLALEMFILQSLKEILQYGYAIQAELDKALDSILENKLHATFRKNFLNDKSHCELMGTSEIFRKFDAAREYRFKIMHRGKRLSQMDAVTNINDIHDVNRYLIDNSSIYGPTILQRAQTELGY